MSDTTITTFFGDEEHPFTMTPWAIKELQRITGSGIGLICRNVLNGDFHHAEIIETIRLSLIGGGMDPQNAAQLVETYATTRPLHEPLALAVKILQRLYLGHREPEQEAANGQT